ncbi:peptide chain release factor N(5)-glutamine methyltransferase [Lachnospiraceae bacterium NSJ-143]|nr:peptide chain release factor N(5)-glutamine methyltransferase [Lachnospiraceae bacterium NSJ-143]
MSRNKTIRKALLEAKERLKAKGVGEYGLDAEIFMMKAVNMDKTGILINGSYELSDNEYKNFNSMVMLRQNGMPSQYILGKCEFMGHDFFVDKNVLIPRPDTEVLVETVLEYAFKCGFKSILDIGTGSGCIAISLLLGGIERAAAVDISKDALNIAAKNAEYNKVADRIKFLNGNLFEPVDKYEKFDAVVSNPPYIPSGDIDLLMREVRDYEPYGALDGGKDGLDFYRKIIAGGADRLKDNGYMFFEIGFDQGESVSELMKEAGFERVSVIKDYSGMDRVVFGFRRRDFNV